MARPRPFSLRRELLTAFALVFAGALLVAVLGVLLIMPLIPHPGWAAVYVIALIAADLAIFTLFGRSLIQSRVLGPLDELVAQVEEIAEGEFGRRVATVEALELARVAESVNSMAEGLIHHREELAQNIRSLEETNVELTQARDELVHAEKMASVGRLAAGIAHEVGNPLGAVMGYLGVLRRGAGDRDREREVELLEAAEREASRIDRIVRGLLDYGRPRETRTQRISAQEVVGETVSLLTAQGRFDGIELSVECDAALPEVQADPYRLQQALVNLVLNAVDAMNGSPRRELRVRATKRVLERRERQPIRRKDDPPGIDYSHRRRFHQRSRLPREVEFLEGTAVEIAVSDTGSGIPAELLDKVFDPFVTSKEPGEGTGLGLAVAARLIDAMDGTILVRSVEGEGSTFTVLLPPASEDGAQET